IRGMAPLSVHLLLTRPMAERTDNSAGPVFMANSLDLNGGPIVQTKSLLFRYPGYDRKDIFPIEGLEVGNEQLDLRAFASEVYGPCTLNGRVLAQATEEYIRSGVESRQELAAVALQNPFQFYLTYADRETGGVKVAGVSSVGNRVSIIKADFSAAICSHETQNDCS